MHGLRPAQGLRPAFGGITERKAGNRDVLQIGLQHGREHEIPVGCGNHNDIRSSKLFRRIKNRIREIIPSNRLIPLLDFGNADRGERHFV